MSSTYQAPSARRSPDTHIRILVLLALLAIFLRLPWFHRSSLSLDEAFTLEFTKHPWPAFWGYVAIYDIHPPLFYARLNSLPQRSLQNPLARSNVRGQSA